MDYGRDNACERIITCTNQDGQSIIFTEKALEPYILCKADGIYDTEMNVALSDNTLSDGATYQGSIMKPRNIILTIKDIQGHDYNRELIDVIFDKNKLGILEVQDGTHVRTIEYYVESVSTTATPVTRLTTISLLCPDPYFYDPSQTSVFIANLVPKFEFIHEFKEEGEEIGQFSEQRLGIIENTSGDDHIGMKIIVQALGTVVNPMLTMVETQEYIAMGTANRPYVMQYGDMFIVNTETGKKNVFDKDGNSINAWLNEDSTFFQIHRGINSIAYDADSGNNYLAVTIMYRYKYVRA